MKSNIYIKPFLILMPLILITIGLFYWLKLPSSQFSGSNTEALLNIESIDGNVFEDIQGRKHDIRVDNNIYIIHFWASWCAPCVEEFPQLIDLSNQMNGKVIVMAISGDANRQEVDVFLKSFPGALEAKNFNIVWDSDKQLIKRWNVNKLPESYIYSPKKKLVKKISGAIDWTTDDAKSFFEVMLKESEKSQNLSQ